MYISSVHGVHASVSTLYCRFVYFFHFTFQKNLSTQIRCSPFLSFNFYLFSLFSIFTHDTVQIWCVQNERFVCERVFVAMFVRLWRLRYWNRKKKKCLYWNNKNRRIDTVVSSVLLALCSTLFVFSLYAMLGISRLSHTARNFFTLTVVFFSATFINTTMFLFWKLVCLIVF